jgi:Ca-activated chloride channel family protein
MAEPPIHLDVLVGQDALAPGTTTGLHVLLRLRAAAQQAGGDAPRLATVLLLDVSGSMSGEPLAQVKDSVERLADILDDQDSLGVVAFSTGARTVSPVRPLAGARGVIRREVRGLEAGGSTNISGGLAQAALLFADAPPGARQVLLLLSDGQPNVGARTPEALRAEVERVRALGPAVSTLGYGAGHDEDVLVAVAEGGGGRYAYVKDPQLASTSFARALGAQRDVVVDNLRLVLSPGPGVEIIRVLGHPRTSVSAEGLRVNLPDALVDEERDVVVQCQVRARKAPGSMRLLHLALAARVAATGQEIFHRREIDIPLSTLGPGEPNAAVAAAAALGLAHELRAEARALADRGNFAGAAALLRQARDLIERAPGFVRGREDKLGDAYEILLDDIATMEKAPDREQYQVYRKAQFDYQALGTSKADLNGRAGTQRMEQAMRGTYMPPPAAQLLRVAGEGAGEVVPLHGTARIGRASANEIVIQDERVTRTHAVINWQGQAFVLVDMGSTNGTLLNGKRIDRATLTHGDTIAIGPAVFRFEHR